MKKIIVLSSITYALKAQELLKNNGIYATIVRSKSVKSVRGCGYGISFDSASIQKAEALLNEYAIPIVGSVEEK